MFLWTVVKFQKSLLVYQFPNHLKLLKLKFPPHFTPNHFNCWVLLLIEGISVLVLSTHHSMDLLFFHYQCWTWFLLAIWASSSLWISRDRLHMDYCSSIAHFGSLCSIQNHISPWLPSSVMAGHLSWSSISTSSLNSWFWIFIFLIPAPPFFLLVRQDSQLTRCILFFSLFPSKRSSFLRNPTFSSQAR